MSQAYFDTRCSSCGVDIAEGDDISFCDGAICCLDCA